MSHPSIQHHLQTLDPSFYYTTEDILKQWSAWQYDAGSDIATFMRQYTRKQPATFQTIKGKQMMRGYQWQGLSLSDAIHQRNSRWEVFWGEKPDQWMTIQQGTGSGNYMISMHMVLYQEAVRRGHDPTKKKKPATWLKPVSYRDVSFTDRDIEPEQYYSIIEAATFFADLQLPIRAWLYHLAANNYFSPLGDEEHLQHERGLIIPRWRGSTWLEADPEKVTATRKGALG